MQKRMFYGIVGVILTTAITGCSLKVDAPINAKLDPTINLDQGILGCLVTVPNGGVVDPGVAVALKVDVGAAVHNILLKAPYKVGSDTQTYSTQTFNINRTYDNNSAQQKVITDQILITDSANKTETCSFSVTVKANATPTTLACSSGITPASPEVGQNVTFQVSASGGTSPYNFSSLSVGDATVGNALTKNGSVATATVAYSTSGSKTLSAVLTDSAGGTATCVKTFTVTGGGSTLPTLTLSAAPSSTVAAGSTITLTATAAGFPSTPTISFAESEDGVTLTQGASVGNTRTATLTATDGKAHSFQVTAVAQASGQYALAFKSLAFTTTATGLACTIDAQWDGSDYSCGNYLYATAKVTGGSGYAELDTVHHDGAYFYDFYGDLSAELLYPLKGTFTLGMVVRDLVTNQTVNCTSISVSPNYTVPVFPVPYWCLSY